MIPTLVSRTHIARAIRRIHQDGIPPRRKSRDYCLVTQRGHLPPKYTIAPIGSPRASFRVRTGSAEVWSQSDFLERLGFCVLDCTCGGTVRDSRIESEKSKPKRSRRAITPKRHTERCRECKTRVREMLERSYGTCLTDHRFEWMPLKGDREMNSLAALLAIACIFAFSRGAHAQPDERIFAPHEQAALVEDILGEDEDRRERAVFVAESLGPSRMSEGVRTALISLLERMNDEQDAARSSGIPTNEVVNGEEFMSVARLVASLDDSRAIPALARVGNHGYSSPVARGLASFGEQALHAIRDVIEAPGVWDDGISTSLVVLAMMVENGGSPALSSSAHAEIVRIARDSLHNQRAGVLSIIKAIELSMLLQEPELIQVVSQFSQNTGVLDARGLDQLSVDLIRTHAAEAISKSVEAE